MGYMARALSLPSSDPESNLSQAHYSLSISRLKTAIPELNTHKWQKLQHITISTGCVEMNCTSYGYGVF